MKKILYISMLAPYDKVDHAGGKVHNFYLKRLHASGAYDITLLSMCWKWEEELLDLKQYGIDNHIYLLDRNLLHQLFRKCVSGFSYINPYDRYGGLLLDYERYHYKRQIRNYAKQVKKGEEIQPEIVILQWTQMIFLMDYVKRLFPAAKIIAIEEDVSFLNYRRRIKENDYSFKNYFNKMRYERVRNAELYALKKADIILNNNHKDLLLLKKEGIPYDKLREVPIFFQTYNSVSRDSFNNDILFYGNMSRPENYESAIWFIENVMPLLSEIRCRFVIVGARPDKKLTGYRSGNIIITGYVDSIAPYFSHCRCMVAPLLLGAGVKVKILEAMSSGIPVLTNHIGIEGIDARDGKEYYHCETAGEYAEMINRLFQKAELLDNEYARQFTDKRYNLDAVFREFMKKELS